MCRTIGGLDPSREQEQRLDPTADVQAATAVPLHRITAPPTGRLWKGRRQAPQRRHDTAETGLIGSFSRDVERGWNVSRSRRRPAGPHDHSLLPSGGHSLLPNGGHSRAHSFRASMQLSELVRQEPDDLKHDPHAGNQDPRDVDVGHAQTRRFPANAVSNAKYTAWSFLPKALYNEFKFFLNVYFLLVALSQVIPYLRIGYMVTYIVPLASVLSVSLGKEAWDDIARRRRDAEANAEPFTVISFASGRHPAGLAEVQKRARDIKVGDVLKLGKNQRVPADVVILQARAPATDPARGEGGDGVAGPEGPPASAEVYIRTDQLDGETDWKLRLPSPLSQALALPDLARLHMSAGAPDKKVNEFVGTLTLQPPPPVGGQYDPYPVDFHGADHLAKTEVQSPAPTCAPLTIDNTAWANTVVASNTTVFAAVVYTGRQTRSALSTSPSRSKTGLLELEINNLTKILCVMTLTLSIILVALEGFEPSNKKAWYVAIMIYLILFSTIIPISLRVNLDMAKLVYGRFIQHDHGIPGTVVRTSTIPEDLGRIEYLLSDKTGTLTQNEMQLRKIHVGTVAYAADAMEEVATYVRQAFGASSSTPPPPPQSSFATKARRDVAARVRDLIVALALCHNVTPAKEEVNGKEFLSYQASSPDEIAIVEFTDSVGLRLAHRDRDTITVQSSDTGQPVLHAQIKEIFPFTSDSKRMGIIKGADTVMSSIVATNDWLDEETGNMAREGLRTLVVARRKLTQEQYRAFSTAYKEASLVLHDREAGMAAVVRQHLEHDLDLLGVTGVEDRLQRDVKPSLELLRNAGVKIWMLTGDKIETARCVAISARLVARGQHIHTLAKLRRKQDAQDALDLLRNRQDCCLLLDGESLALMLTHFRHNFISLAVGLPAVIACRCSPNQKAEVALLIRQHTNKRVCCIGDGGNDVSMIQAADVGIGIVGKEGRQASLAADFSITQFCHLTKLLLWHGRNSYKRSAKLGQFIIHRGLIIAVCQTMYNIASKFDPKGLFKDWLLVGYATVYTTAPVFSLVLDTDVDEQLAKLYPELYKELKAGQALSYRSFFAWVAVSVYQGIIIQGLSQLLVGEVDGKRMLAVSFTVLILNELIMVAVSVTTWHPVMIASILGTAAIYAISVPFLPSYFDLAYVASWAWAWRVAAIAAISLVPVWGGKLIGRAYKPPNYRKSMVAAVPIGTVLLANALLVAALLIFAAGFFPYKAFLPGLAEWNESTLRPTDSPPFDKVIFMVVDALRSDFVYGNQSHFVHTQQLIRDGAAIPFTGHASPPTITMPRVKAITTGSVPSFVDLVLNFAESDTTSTLATQDSWLAQMRAKNTGNLVMYGDDTWLRLFPGFFHRSDGTTSFFVSDFVHVDNNVTRNVGPELDRDDWSVMVLHYLGLDHIGHKTGPRGPIMPAKQAEMDQIVARIYQAMKTGSHLKNTLLVLLGDHGMNDAGNHGASSAGEVSTALTFISDKLKKIGSAGQPCPAVTPDLFDRDFSYYHVVQQSDIAPTLAALLGIPVPRNNLGILISPLIALYSRPQDVYALWYENGKQMHEIARATFPAPFDADYGESLCSDLPDPDELACLWSKAEKRHLQHPHDYVQNTEAVAKFLRKAQNTLSGTASNYDTQKLLVGIALAIAATLVAAWAVVAHQALKLDALSALVFLLLTLSYGGTMFASSYVEEEHEFWYWAAGGWLVFLYKRAARYSWQGAGARSGQLALVLICLLYGIGRRWNQTGQKYAGDPDLVSEVWSKSPFLLWVLIIASYTLFSRNLSQRAIKWLNSKQLAVLPVFISMTALVFKIALTAADAPELVNGVTVLEPIVAFTQKYSLVGLARVSFLGLAQLLLCAIYYEAPWTSHAHLASFLASFLDTFSLFLLTQTRAANIPLFGIAYLQLRLFEQLQPQPVGLITITSLLFQFSSFFALGGTNAISSVDLSNAYNGIAGYNVGLVGLLTFIGNWAGPIFWTIATCRLIAEHLFVWTVFSPKYLYQIAWVCAQHLLVNGTAWLLMRLAD
ncbi:hypothetical protein DV737_g260, partial [Chaetothyriales sp. CBS 132003]